MPSQLVNLNRLLEEYIEEYPIILKRISLKSDLGSITIPIRIIILERAEYYLGVDPEFKDRPDLALRDTLDLFTEDKYEITDWFLGNMETEGLLHRGGSYQVNEDEVLRSILQDYDSTEVED